MPPKKAKPASTRTSKRKANQKPPVEPVDTTKSVLGGMKGGSRLTGEETTTEDNSLLFDVPFDGKSIVCQKTCPPGSRENPPQLIFTHGAGGGIANPATKSFADGFASHGPIVCFQGTMNLKSRVKTFIQVMEDQDFGGALGGRSMGARAAVMAAEETGKAEALVLVSYPLTSPKGDMRDQILLDIDEEISVLFVIGSKDSMCDLEDLAKVRGKMKAKSWLVVVEGADHGMSVSNKSRMETMRKETGAFAAQWLKGEHRAQTEVTISADGKQSAKTAEVEDSTTNDDTNDSKVKNSKVKKSKGKQSKSAAPPSSTKRKKKAAEQEEAEVEDKPKADSRSSKRHKKN